VHDLGRRQYRRVGAFENTAAKIQTENERLKRLSAHHGTTTTTYAATATRDMCNQIKTYYLIPHRAVAIARKLPYLDIF
jgi:predicted DNA-binding protein